MKGGEREKWFQRKFEDLMYVRDWGGDRVVTELLVYNRVCRGGGVSRSGRRMHLVN